MGSSSKRQTTMAKMARERALQERRAMKQQKKDERKQAAAAARDAKAGEPARPESGVEGDGRSAERSTAPSDEISDAE